MPWAHVWKFTWCTPLSCVTAFSEDNFHILEIAGSSKMNNHVLCNLMSFNATCTIFKQVVSMCVCSLCVLWHAPRHEVVNRLRSHRARIASLFLGLSRSWYHWFTCPPSPRRLGQLLLGKSAPILRQDHLCLLATESETQCGAIGPPHPPFPTLAFSFRRRLSPCRWLHSGPWKRHRQTDCCSKMKRWMRTRMMMKVWTQRSYLPAYSFRDSRVSSAVSHPLVRVHHSLFQKPHLLNFAGLNFRLHLRVLGGFCEESLSARLRMTQVGLADVNSANCACSCEHSSRTRTYPGVAAELQDTKEANVVSRMFCLCGGVGQDGGRYVF